MPGQLVPRILPLASVLAAGRARDVRVRRQQVAIANSPPLFTQEQSP